MVLKKLRTERPYDPASPPLGLGPQEVEAGCQRDIRRPRFTVFTEPEGGQHTKHPGGDQAWSVHTMAYQSAFGGKDSDPCYDTDEPRHGRYAKQKEPDAKAHVVYGFIYGKYPEQTSADGQKGDWRWPGAGGARPGRGCDRQRVSF